MTLEIPLWFEIGTYIALVLILAADVFLAYRRPHVPRPGVRAVDHVLRGARPVFAGLMLLIGDAEHAGQFVAGWLTEYSLSIDNLFVFLIIMARFSVPRKYQQEILMVGIILALVFRGIFILLGAALISNFSWIFYIFGLFLVYTAANQAFTAHDEEEQMENSLIRMLRAASRSPTATRAPSCEPPSTAVASSRPCSSSSSPSGPPTWCSHSTRSRRSSASRPSRSWSSRRTSSR
jgi:tellurite resistance protein TerC